MAIQVDAFLTLALSEIRIARGGDVVSPDDMAQALALFNEYLDALNADGRALFTTAIPSFTLTANLQPHTIGLTGNTPTFTVTIGRPVRILAANLILANNIRSALRIRDRQWWMSLRAPAITSSVPRDLYYAPDWPNGSIYLWPVPITAYGIELQTETLLAQVAATDSLDLPMGYQQALRLTLAELMAPSFGQKPSDATIVNGREARARVWGNNDVIPTLNTRDAGMPGGDGGYFDYRTGMVT